MGRVETAKQRKAKRLEDLKGEEKKVVEKIQSALSVDLLKGKYSAEVSWPEHDVFRHIVEGQCYVATEALFYLYGRKNGYRPYERTDENGNTHWWLANEEGEILDPTLQQIEKGFRYSEGKPRAFLTKRPSKRAKELIRRIERKR